MTSRSGRVPTIYDVAREAGVSHQTVSRYLRGYEGIRPATRERVQEALTRLEYRPNSAARLLRAGVVNRIGLVAFRMSAPGPARLVGGANAAARAGGYMLDIVSVDEEDAESIDKAVSMLAEHQLAGVVLTAATEGLEGMLLGHGLDVPHVSGARVKLQGDGMPLNEYAGRIAARHLIELGHREIGYLSGPLSWVSARDRRAGFLAELQDHGLTVAAEAEGDWLAATGAAAWSTLTAQSERLTAVGAGNDSMAVGLISAIAASGRSVPGDVSVIGTDDSPEAAYLNPPLSTVAMAFESEGAHLVAALLAKISGSRQRVPDVAAPELRPRSSTAALR
ncbi:LacI family DNA-binding transcriptional regulator [Microbacterium sp. 22195]|uniref:LacI family DNA-binding transcriptional regulator n=1 Tax=Microbacterium sp. 22195 TaxID=3453891 RepID=UPI003F83ADF9